MTGHAILEARDLTRHYEVKAGVFAKPRTLKALDGVSFELHRGKSLAVVGESGCGKSTLARLITLIEPPTAGDFTLDGVAASGADRRTVRTLRHKVQMVFQDPYGSLNPRKKVGTILEEPLAINTDKNAAERKEAALAMMDLVGLRREHYGRFPHMFSGGQRQRSPLPAR